MYQCHILLPHDCVHNGIRLYNGTRGDGRDGTRERVHLRDDVRVLRDDDIRNLGHHNVYGRDD